MLAAPNRLVSSAAFSTAVRGGRRAGSRTLVVHVALPASGAAAGATRVGFVVSRAVGNAVVRNRVKRRLRHLMRDRVERAPRGSSVVVRALPASADCDAHDLGRDLDHCLGSALR